MIWRKEDGQRQTDWKNDKSIDVFGKPRLGFLVCGGNMDSMVNHYSVSKKRRQKDAYSPGGEMGLRPDYATTVYCNLIRRTYKDVPIIIGGIEASLRRMAHYDYWSDKLKHSILVDSSADILSYGMGEPAIGPRIYQVFRRMLYCFRIMTALHETDWSTPEAFIHSI